MIGSTSLILEQCVSHITIEITEVVCLIKSLHKTLQSLLLAGYSCLFVSLFVYLAMYSTKNYTSDQGRIFIQGGGSTSGLILLKDGLVLESRIVFVSFGQYQYA